MDITVEAMPLGAIIMRLYYIRIWFIRFISSLIAIAVSLPEAFR